MQASSTPRSISWPFRYMWKQPQFPPQGSWKARQMTVWSGGTSSSIRYSPEPPSRWRIHRILFPDEGRGGLTALFPSALTPMSSQSSPWPVRGPQSSFQAPPTWPELTLTQASSRPSIALVADCTSPSPGSWRTASLQHSPPAVKSAQNRTSMSSPGPRVMPEMDSRLPASSQTGGSEKPPPEKVTSGGRVSGRSLQVVSRHRLEQSIWAHAGRRSSRTSPLLTSPSFWIRRTYWIRAPDGPTRVPKNPQNTSSHSSQALQGLFHWLQSSTVNVGTTWAGAGGAEMAQSPRPRMRQGRSDTGPRPRTAALLRDSALPISRLRGRGEIRCLAPVSPIEGRLSIVQSHHSLGVPAPPTGRPPPGP